MLAVGVLMSSGPEVVLNACAGLDGVRLIGIAEPADLSIHIDTLDGLIVSNDFYPPEVAALLRDGAPRLRWLQSSSTGFEHFLERGVPSRLAFTQPGPVYSEVVAEHAVGLLLALGRGVLQMERLRARRVWDRLSVVPELFSLKNLYATRRWFWRNWARDREASAPIWHAGDRLYAPRANAEGGRTRG